MIRHIQDEAMPYYAKISRLSICISLLLSCSAICAAQEKKKLAFAILIDNTGSMRLQFELVKGIGKGVVHQVYDHGPVSLFSFESEGIGRDSRAVPTSRIEQTQDEQLLDRTIDNAYVKSSPTTLLYAIKLMAERW